MYVIYGFNAATTVGHTVEGGLNLALVKGAVGGAIAAVVVTIIAITLCVSLLVVCRRRKKATILSGTTTLVPCHS